MFVVLLTYAQPLTAVDAQLAAHREYLQRQYAAGVFLLSGPKQPRDGGVILARAASVDALRAILAEDPFAVHGVATYEVLQFMPTMSAQGLQSLLAG